MTITDNPRYHGTAPYRVAVVHGGPGALGGMGEVARALGDNFGVLEPIQTEASIDGQIEELAKQIETCGAPPMMLIGHSWGAWLVMLLAARYPQLVDKLVLVCAGPFESRYAEGLMDTRLQRLSPTDQQRTRELMNQLNDPTPDSEALAEFGALMSATDDYDPLPPSDEASPGCRDDIFSGVWPAAAKMRETGELLQCAARVTCPVVAIHGEHDPHPWRGVKEPLQRTLADFSFHLLPNCGHTPWRERQARNAFMKLLSLARTKK